MSVKIVDFMLPHDKQVHALVSNISFLKLLFYLLLFLLLFLVN